LAGQLRKHVILTFIGVVVAVTLVAWVRPETPGGTTFLVVVAILAVNAIGATIARDTTDQSAVTKRRSEPDHLQIPDHEGPHE
jgi:hypothetical protein